MTHSTRKKGQARPAIPAKKYLSKLSILTKGKVCEENYRTVSFRSISIEKKLYKVIIKAQSAVLELPRKARLRV